MKGRWTVLVLAAVALLANAGCNDYGNTFQVPTGATLTSLSPATVPAGNPSFTLTLNGGGFVAKTVVQWNGSTIPTQLQTDSAGTVTGITAMVDASLVTKTGTAFVNTLSPHSGSGTNGLSNTLAFIINPPPNPVPVVTGNTSPSCALAGGLAFTLTINGSSFLPTSDPSGGSQVRWSAGSTQTTLAASNITSAQIQASVPASLIVLGAPSAIVSVYNPPSPQTVPPGTVGNPPSGGGGTSANSPAFTVVQPPASCPAGTTAVTAQASVAQETPAVSADGRYVGYSAPQNGHNQVFVRDTCEGAQGGCQPRTLLLSAAADGTPGNDESRTPSMSADGRYVAFSSAATNLVAETPAGRQIYVRDTCVGATGECTPSTQLVSTDGNGTLAGTESILPSISASGRFVGFVAVTASPSANKASSQATPITETPNSGYRQVFVRDTCAGATNCTPKTTRISLEPGDASQTEGKPAGPAVSGAGSHVALSNAGASTLFTHAVAVDDRVFLALTKNQ